MKPDIKGKLSQKTSIKVLHLGNGRLNDFPKEVFKFEKLEVLDLFSNRISELPDDMYRLTNLETLNLNGNKFESVPSVLFVLPRIKNLSLKDNKISKISPSDFSNLAKLKKLDISYNSIVNLPLLERVDSSLMSLNLSGNLFSSFPFQLNSFTGLTHLNLSNNRIKSFKDEDFSTLDQLESLDLSNNSITYLPPSIGQLKNLKVLILSGNDISYLPKEFENLVNLETLELSGNPIERTPIEIAAQGPQGVINYYLSLGENVKLFEAKLLLVGQGSVGKTFLMNRIVYDKTPETSTTEGIEINQWNIKTESSDNFRVNIWDFGGQEIYHSTHQFFLTKRSLYILVWEARSDQHLISFDYWLNVIRLLSAESPTLVVMNKIDERIVAIDQKSLQNKFNNIKQFHQVSAKTGVGMPDLIDNIKKIIDTLPLIGDKLPKVWAEIRQALEGLDQNFIPKEEYFKICNRYGQSNKGALFLSQYFHDLGVFLHFQDNALLENLIFLKPEWATNAVYKILDYTDVIRANGEFTYNELKEILNEYPVDKHLYIIELMKKFELCYAISSDRYLIPELLKPERLDYDWNYSDNLRFEYHYDFMPAGILARFIVRTKDLIYESINWKNGVVLMREGTLAQIISDQFTRKIKIWIDGDNAALLLDIIRREIDHINKTLNYFDVMEKIPCACTQCIKDENPHLFNYKFVREANRTKKLKTVNCEKSFQGVSVYRLIGLYSIDSPQNTMEEAIRPELILHDIIEVCSRILERKFTKKIENLLNDDLTDLLRTKGYNVTDQTRSGRSGGQGKDAGEIDLMIRSSRSVPLSIIECFRLDNCGSANTVIAKHISKLLSDYDTHGLSRNFIVVFFEGVKFERAWDSYVKYMNNLGNNESFNSQYPLSGFSRQPGLSPGENMKIGFARHEREGNEVEVVHLFLNMK